MTLALPTREEAWRWADPAAIEAAAAEPRRAAQSGAELFLDLDGPRLLFVDGVFQPDRSAPGPVAVEPLALRSAHPLASRATGTGWRIALGAEQAIGTVQIAHVATGGENHLPGEITLAEDGAAAIVESFVGAGWSNRLTRIALGRSARLMRAVRLVQDSGFVSLRDEAALARGASLATVVLAAGGMGCRVDAAITLDGPEAFAEFGGALLGRATQRQEAAVVVRHAAPHGASHQLWRLVAEDQAIGSAAARVEVARGAQRTDAVQSLRGLLLQRTAAVNLKPELEIFADDVKCAHGATVGELDRQALFYLQSRGLPPAQASALMTRSFVGDALARIGQEAVRDAFAADADAWLENAR